MAFVSIDKMKKFTREDSRCTGPQLTITVKGIGYINRALYDDVKPSTIEMEVDFETRQVRLRVGENLPKTLTGRVKHTFNIPVAAYKNIVPAGEKNIKIALTKSDDGWWYGRFGGAA